MADEVENILKKGPRSDFVVSAAVYRPEFKRKEIN